MKQRQEVYGFRPASGQARESTHSSHLQQQLLRSLCLLRQHRLHVGQLLLHAIHRGGGFLFAMAGQHGGITNAASAGHTCHQVDTITLKRGHMSEC